MTMKFVEWRKIYNQRKLHPYKIPVSIALRRESVKERWEKLFEDRSCKHLPPYDNVYFFRLLVEEKVLSTCDEFIREDDYHSVVVYNMECILDDVSEAQSWLKKVREYLRGQGHEFEYKRD